MAADSNCTSTDRGVSRRTPIVRLPSCSMHSQPHRKWSAAINCIKEQCLHAFMHCQFNNACMHCQFIYLSLHFPASGALEQLQFCWAHEPHARSHSTCPEPTKLPMAMAIASCQQLSLRSHSLRRCGWNATKQGNSSYFPTGKNHTWVYGTLQKINKSGICLRPSQAHKRSWGTNMWKNELTCYECLVCRRRRRLTLKGWLFIEWERYSIAEATKLEQQDRTLVLLVHTSYFD